MNRLVALVILALIASIRVTTTNTLQSTSRLPYRNKDLPVEDRVKDLLSRMSLEEKVRQMDMYSGDFFKNGEDFSAETARQKLGSLGVGAVHDIYPKNAEMINALQRYVIGNNRWGIPALIMCEMLHGYTGEGSTAFPMSIGLAATWDRDVMKNVGRVIASEARAHGVHYGLGPNLDLGREPRWGRVAETFGEDTYLASEIALAMVRGLQGDNLRSDNSIIAEPKHFAAHGVPLTGSNASPVLVGERTVRQDYLPVFEKAFIGGGALGTMAAYSELDGIPCAANKWLLTDVLRGEWGFKGIVVSDLGAIRFLETTHHVSSSQKDSIRQAIDAGIDMQFYDFPNDFFQKTVVSLVEERKITRAQIDRAAGGVLRLKFLLGLFENPFVDPRLIAERVHTRQHQDSSLDAALKSICLLKNQRNLLPLKRSAQIAVIGPNADKSRLGGYSVRNRKAITVLEGIKEVAGRSASVLYDEGVPLIDKGQVIDMSRAIEIARKSDVAIVVVGESEELVEENRDVATLDLFGKQMDLVKAIHETGTPVVCVLLNGRPLSFNWIAEQVPAIVECWFPGERGGLAVAKVLFGDYNPAGRLPITFPKSVGQLPFYYNQKPSTIHRYVGESDKPLYPFGYGLSYTSFEYSNLRIAPEKSPDARVAVSVDVKNTGDRDGEEVAQLYIRDIASSVTTPVKTLKGFQRLMLAKGEIRRLTFELTADELSIWNREMKRVVEPGVFEVMVGGNSEDLIKARFTVTSSVEGRRLSRRRPQ
jgi:beta-glucosidase